MLGFNSQGNHWPATVPVQNSDFICCLISGLLLIMNYLFGGPKAPPQQPQQPYKQPVPQQPTYTGPPVQMENLQKKSENKCRELSELITGLEREAAQLYGKSKEAKGSSKQMYKERCTQVLKKKKLYEQQLKQYMGQQNVLDQVNFTRENIQNTVEMGHMMKQTVEQQKAMMQHVNLDQLQDLRDEMDQMKFESDYTNELLSRNYDTGYEDIDLDAEMQEIDNDFYQQVMKNPKQAIKVPNQQIQDIGSLQKNSLKF